jgi:hypothetical protein
MAQKQSALQAAMNGDADKLTDKQAKGALSQAIGKLANLTKKAETSKEAVVNTGTALMHSAETLGSLFLSSMAEGYVGPEKLKLGGVDLRAPTGLLAQGYGLYQILSGESGGAHALALGNGVTGSWLASVGQEAGRALRERRSGAAPAGSPQAFPTTFRGEGPMVHVPAVEGAPGVAGHYLPAGRVQVPPQAYPQMSLIPEPTMRVAGPVREIMLTPDADSRAEGEIAGPRHRMRRAAARRGAGNRFPRANAAEEAPEAD